MKLPKQFIKTSPGFWEYEMHAWLREPISLNKFLLVSWRMSGSEFCKEVIRENYPETIPLNYWAKSHINLDDELSKNLLDIANTKVFLIITDPREVAIHLSHFDGGQHLHEFDYHLNHPPNTVEFLNKVADKQIELIDTYKKQFGDNCIVLRYEDALFYQNTFLDKVSNFLGLESLGIDDIRKYKWSIYRNVGNFWHFYEEDILKQHYNEYKWFYNKWDYPENGLQELRYKWHGRTSTIRNVKNDYKEMLKRNGILPSDRTNNIDEF